MQLGVSCRGRDRQELISHPFLVSCVLCLVSCVQEQTGSRISREYLLSSGLSET